MCSRDLDSQLALFEARLRAKVDRRVHACRVEAQPGTGATVTIRGFVMFPQTLAFVTALAHEVFAGCKVTTDIGVLAADPSPVFHRVVTPTAPFYPNPWRSKADLLTEGLYGGILRTFHASNGHVFAQSRDGYVGYVPRRCLAPAGLEEYLRWKNGVCGVLLEPVEVAAGLLLPPSARLPLEGGALVLGDGRRVKPPKSKWRQLDPSDPSIRRELARHARCFSDTAYLWGGKSTDGIDCSGFAQTLLLAVGVALPRDASMQAYAGEIVGYLPGAADLLPGDLMFFMNNKAHVYHVAVCMGRGQYLHSSGKHGVAMSAFAHDGDNHLPKYTKDFVFGRRVCVR